MTGIRWWMLAGLVLVAGLLSAGTASAGPLWDWITCQCSPPSYSPARYWAPELARGYDCIHGPKLSLYATDLHPDVPPTFAVIKFPCPPAAPVSTILPPPTAPATSRAR